MWIDVGVHHRRSGFWPTQPEDPMNRRFILTLIAGMALTTTAIAQTASPGATPSPTPSGSPSATPNKVRLYFISPQNGETVSSPVTVRFGLSGMGVAPAGVDKENTGHHHLLIDTDLPKLDEPIPMDDNHRHFGAGQTEARIALPPGQHTLQLLLGNWSHVPHSPPVVSEKITINVE
jgi:Domain of unknown function (DUF4399)